jgi:WD40 repeat protein
MRMSKSMVSWTEHTGAIMCIEFIHEPHNRLVSASNYGEIIISNRQGNRLRAQKLFSDSKYDFRDVDCEADGSIYAVSRTGHLIIIAPGGKTVKIIDLDNIGHPMRLHRLRDNIMLVVGENGLALVDQKRMIVRNTQSLPFRLITSARKNNEVLLFDDQGMVHQLKGLDQYTTEKVPVAGKLTTYCYSRETGIEAYGMSDGTIWTVDKKGNQHKLIGHRSRISKLNVNGNLLYSSSYDGSVKLWAPTNEKAEPMTLIETSNWIMDFDFDTTKNTFWMGDAKGNLAAVNISVPQMVDVIKKKIKRNLTTEEWNYYIGQNVPYEEFIYNSGKEVAP